MRRTTILIVTADSALMRSMSELLASRGHRTPTAACRETAVRIVQRMALDLIVLDLVLPDDDGLVALAALREITPKPILLIGSGRDRREAVLGLKLGADDCIQRSVDLVEIDARVEVLLRRARKNPPLSAGSLRIYSQRSRFRGIPVPGARTGAAPSPSPASRASRP